MKRMKRILLYFLLILGAAASFGYRAFAAEKEYPSPSFEFYVFDEENVLSENTQKLILDVNKQYEKTEEKPQIVVAVISSLNGLSIEEFSVELFEQWKIGNSKLDNGVLILLAVEERKSVLKLVMDWKAR